MRLTDRSIWTAPPPNAVRQATAQPVTEEQALATYYYFLVAHYPIGAIVSEPFACYRAPKPTDGTNYVMLSWEAAPTATSYDVLRSETLPLPTDGTPLALALGVTATTFLDQGQPILPYPLTGLMNGSPVSGWLAMNNKDYSKPVLEFSDTTVRMSSVMFSDGSELATASGGGAAVVTGINGVQGAVTLAPGQSISITQAGSTITIAAAATGANGQIQFNNAGQFGASPNLTWNGSQLLVSGAPIGSQIPTGGTPPAAPQEGQLWYNTSTFRLAIHASGTWIQIA